MKLLVHVHLHRLINGTGVGRVTRSLVEQLAAMDQDDLRLLCRVPERGALATLGEPWTEFEYYCFARGISAQQAMWLLSRWPPAERWWPDAQVVYSPAESFVPTRRARSAVTVHDLAYFEGGAHRRTVGFRLQQAKWRFLFSMFERHADLVHAISQFTGERLAHFFPGLRDRIRVIPNAIAQRFFQPTSAGGEAELAERGLVNQRYILLPGGLHHRKNADLVLSAWPLISHRDRDVLLVVAGGNDPALAAQAASLDRTMLLGYVGDELLCSLYHTAEIVWFPSRYEGFGLPVLEAMACGTAVVASDAAALPEVASGAASLISAEKPGYHADEIRALLANAGRRSAMEALGRARAAPFTWARSAAALREQLVTLA